MIGYLLFVNCRRRVFSRVSAFVPGAFLHLFFALTLYCAPAQAQDVAHLVTSPPIVNVPVSETWSYETEFELGVVYQALKDGDYSTASEFIKRVTAAVPQDRRALQLAVHVAMTTQSWKEAESYLARLLNIQPNDLPAMARLGFVRTQLKKYRLAASSYRNALAYGPSSEFKAYLEDSLARIQADVDVETKNMAALVNDERALLKQQLASLAAQGHLDEEEKLLDRFLLDWPGDPEAVIARGRLHLKQGKHREARNDFTLVRNNSQAQEYHAAAEEGLTEAGRLFLVSELAEAEKLKDAYQWTALESKTAQLLNEHPDNAEILLLRAEAFISGDVPQTEKARRDIEAALSTSALNEKGKLVAQRLLARLEPPPVMDEQKTDLADAQAEPSGPDWNEV